MPKALSLPFFSYRFILQWRMLLLTLLGVALLTRLGFWQLQRAEVKKNALIQFSLAKKAAPSLWQGQKPLQYQRMILQGQFLRQLFLLDNQHVQHQFGYNVWSPLQLSDGSLVLVDRGFIVGDARRLIFPHPDIPLGEQKILGSVYYPSVNPWILGPAFEKKGNNTLIVEGFDAKWLQQILQKKVHSFIIRLDKNQPFGFHRDWTIVSMPPERHVGYALQWFAMALVLLIIFIVLHVKKNEN